MVGKTFKGLTDELLAWQTTRLLELADHRDDWTVYVRPELVVEIALDGKAKDLFKEFQDAGFGNYPVCIAKTQYSFSTDPAALGAPTGHMVNVREVRLAAAIECRAVCRRALPCGSRSFALRVSTRS